MCKTRADIHKLKTRHDGKTSEKTPGKRAALSCFSMKKTGREPKAATKTPPYPESYQTPQLQAVASPSIIPTTSHARSKETTNMHTDCSAGCTVSPAGESYSWNPAFLRGLGRGIWAESNWEAFWTFFKGHSLLLITAAMTQTDGYTQYHQR